MPLDHHLQQSWFQYLDSDLQRLVRLSIKLYDREEKSTEKLEDYSFVIFPISKAYEGFLKLFLKNTGLISSKAYLGKRFRIGRSLNPDIPEKYRDEYWLFDNLEDKCSNKVAREIWDTWLTCRNQVFHFFPSKPRVYDLSQSRDKLLKVIESMKLLVSCS